MSDIVVGDAAFQQCQLDPFGATSVEQSGGIPVDDVFASTNATLLDTHQACLNTTIAMHL